MTVVVDALVVMFTGLVVATATTREGKYHTAFLPASAARSLNFRLLELEATSPYPFASQLMPKCREHELCSSYHTH